MDPSPFPNTNPIISIKNLHKSYGDKQVLKGIQLDVYKGQVLGYIGPNGAGKSTTVKILCGLLTEFEGEVLVNGVNVQTNPVMAKKMIGYVPELAELYDVLSPREFLSLMGDLYEMEPVICQERLVKMMGAFGLSDNVDQRMDTFSKGMKQRVLLISGIIHNPEIIILDEPLSGLDANSVIMVKELINRLAKEGKTIFYCSHMMDVVEKVSDRIIVIDKGSIVADGSFEELQKKDGNESLEKIFAHLTSGASGDIATDELMRAFD